MNDEIIKILFLGDIVGRPGRSAVANILPTLKKDMHIDFVIANGENLAAGKGMTLSKYQEMMDIGIDYFTSGNHIWNNEDMVANLSRESVKVLRPANYPAGLPGRGYAQVKISGAKLTIINLQGRVFMKDDIEDPFVIGKNIIDGNQNSIIIIDFHAEATSEKIALGYYFDGKISALIGTHTHVQTADEKILEGGTAYITDAGMCGPIDSVLGVKKEIIIEKFLTQLPQSHKVAKGDSILNGVVITIDKKTKKAKTIKRLSKIVKL